MQDDGDALENKLGEAKGSLAAAYAALNRNYDEQRKGGDQTRSNTLSDVARTYVGTNSPGGSDKNKLIPGSNRSSGTSRPDRSERGGNGLGKFLETEDLEKLNMLAAAQKVAAYHVQQSPLLTVVRTLLSLFYAEYHHISFDPGTASCLSLRSAVFCSDATCCELY